MSPAIGTTFPKGRVELHTEPPGLSLRLGLRLRAECTASPERVAALLARSLRLEPSSFRSACCPPVLVVAHQGVVKPGSLLQRVDENMAAHASSDAYQWTAVLVMEELQLVRLRRLLLRRRPARLEQVCRAGSCWLSKLARVAAQVISWICSHSSVSRPIYGGIFSFHQYDV